MPAAKVSPSTSRGTRGPHCCRALCLCCCCCLLLLFIVFIVLLVGAILPLGQIGPQSVEVCGVSRCGHECPESSSPASTTTRLLIDVRVHNPTIFSVGVSSTDSAVTLVGHGDNMDPATSADATISAGALVGCSLARGGVTLPPGWGEVALYCELASHNAPSEALMTADGISVRVSYFVAVEFLMSFPFSSSMTITANEADFSLFRQPLQGTRRELNEHDRPEGCANYFEELAREAAALGGKPCAVQVCGGAPFASIQADSGRACAAHIEERAANGSIPMDVDIQVSRLPRHDAPAPISPSAPPPGRSIILPRWASACPNCSWPWSRLRVTGWPNTPAHGPRRSRRSGWCRRGN